jgi:predicted nucleotidyltransferase
MAAVITQPSWAVTPEKIQEAVRRLVAAAHPIRIIMFGSQSRGGGDRDSDLDLVVIEREVPNRVAEMIRLERALRGMVLPTDILVISEKDFEEWAEMPGSVYYDAKRDGKVLYEAV